MGGFVIKTYAHHTKLGWLLPDRSETYDSDQIHSESEHERLV